MTAVYQGLSWAAFRTRSEPWGDVADSSLETRENEMIQNMYNEQEW